ncbi:MAG: pilus assembly protein [Acidimicrobiales bacterium]|nr:pilus assembly protein [Acidimicrobiales bacterium]
MLLNRPAGDELSAVDRGTGDRGVALVEAGLVTPVLMFILIAIMEGGLLFRDWLTLGNMTAGGARSAAIAGSDPLADWQILQELGKGGTGLQRANIQHIAIFKASSATSTIPLTCKTVAVSGTCNVYAASDLTLPQTSTAFTCIVGVSKDRFWCPTTRKNAVFNNNGNGPPDWIGVYVRYNHISVSSMFGSSMILEDQTVTKLEPRKLV